jgi:hypothetical protein
MKAAAHVFQSGAEAGQRVRLQIDIAECDDACSRGLHQAIALPVDTGITDRALGIVVDRELALPLRLISSRSAIFTLSRFSRVFQAHRVAV